MPGALEARELAEQQLAAPDRAVGRRSRCRRRSRPRAGPGLAVLGQARREVRVVVLHADQLARPRARARTWWRGTRGAGRAPRPRARPRTAARSGRCPPRTSAASRSSRGRRRGGPPRRARPSRAQNVFFSSAPQASRCRPQSHRQRERVRHVAARAPQQHRGRPAAVAHHRVVGARLDRPVVEQEQVGDLREPLAARPRRDRRSARRRRCRSSSRASRRRRPAAGGGAASRAASRRARASPGATDVRHRRVRAPRGRARSAARGRAAAPPRRGFSSTSSRAAAEVRRHQRERLVLAVLARAQLGHRGLVVGPAGEVEAADALHRDDRPAEQRAGGRLERVARARVLDVEPARVDEPHPRPAVGAGVRLGVEAAVRRVLVLARGRPGTSRTPAIVVFGRSYGHAAHDREARTAVRAVGERVAVAPVGGVEQLGQAVGAGRAVGRDGGARLAARRALADREAALARAPRAARRSRARRSPAAAPRRAAGRGSAPPSRAAPRPRPPPRARRSARSRPGRARPRAGRRTGGSPRPAPCPRRGATRRAAHAGSAPPARAARGRRSPAPPGCAGCARSA